MARIAALDIGCSKIVFAVAEYSGSDSIGNMQIVAHGENKCNNLLKGGKVDSVDLIAGAIEKALEQIPPSKEQISENIIINISGNDVKCRRGCGIIAVGGEQITAEHVEMAKKAANQVNDLPSGYEIVSVIPRCFIVDGLRNVISPIGLYAYRLECESYVCIAESMFLNNIRTAVAKSGLTIHPKGIICSAFASSLAVLSEDEKDVGTACIDIGYGCTDLSVFYKGDIIYSASIALGGRNIINDIAQLCRISEDSAEKYMIEMGVSDPEYLSEGALEQVINTNSLSNSGEADSAVFTYKELAEIISCRFTDFCEWIEARLDEVHKQYHLNIPNIALVGGVSKLQFLSRRFSNALNIHTRVALPCNPFGLDNSLRRSEYASVIGLLIYGVRYLLYEEGQTESKPAKSKLGELLKTANKWLESVRL